MDTEKTAQLDRLLNSLEQRWGAGVVRRLSEHPQEPQSGLRTGFSSLDGLLGNTGIPRGQVTELLGRPTSGMTTLAYRILACTQHQDTYAIYLDGDSTFDPDYAVQCGIRLDRFFLAHPDTEDEALDIARDLLSSRSVGIIGLDVGTMEPNPARLRRLTAVLSPSGCAVLVLRCLQDRVHWQRSSSPAVLRLLVERRSWLERQTDIRGYQAQVTLLKHPTLTGKSTQIEIDFDDTRHGAGL